MDNENLRVEALQTAAKLAMSSNLPRADVLGQAREFYAFLSGDKGATIPDGTYKVTIKNPSIHSGY